MQDYYLRNKDYILARNKKYREANKDMIKEHRHLAYMANREKHIKDVMNRYYRKKKFTGYKFPKIDEKREELTTERAKYEYDKNWGKRKDSMKEYYKLRWAKHLEKNRKIRQNRKLKKIQKRKEETNRL